jgi:hypothetical protein
MGHAGAASAMGIWAWWVGRVSEPSGGEPSMSGCRWGATGAAERVGRYDCHGSDGRSAAQGGARGTAAVVAGP